MTSSYEKFGRSLWQVISELSYVQWSEKIGNHMMDISGYNKKKCMVHSQSIWIKKLYINGLSGIYNKQGKQFIENINLTEPSNLSKLP